MGNFHELAVLPSCLLAVSAIRQRPAWFSQLHSNVLRNFEIRGQVWKELTDKIKSARTADFKLSLSFSASPNYSLIQRSLVLCTTWSSDEQCCISYWKNDSKNRLRISIIGLYEDEIPGYYVDVPGFTLDDEVEAEIIVERKATELAISMNGVEIYRKERSNPKAVTFNLSGNSGVLQSAFNGGFHFLRFESGAEIWEAGLASLRVGKIELHDFNFSKKWNCSSWSTAGSDDFEFFIDFELTQEANAAEIFSVSDQESTIDLKWENGQSLTSFKLFEGDSWIFNSPKLMTTGRHSLLVARSGLAGRVEVDGEVAQSWGGEKPLPVVMPTQVLSHFPGFIHASYFKNMTASKIIWQLSPADLNDEIPALPFAFRTSSDLSPSENAGLLKAVNMLIRDGVFRPLDESAPSRLETRLDFRNRVQPFTVAVEAYFPWIANDSKAHFFGLMQQGDVLASSGTYKVFGLYAQISYLNFKASYELVFNITSTDSLQSEIKVQLIPSFFNKSHMVAASFAPVDASSFFLSLFIDGELQARQKFENVIARLNNEVTQQSENYDVSKVFVFSQPYTGRTIADLSFKHGLIFDRELSDEEMAALSLQQKKTISLLEEGSKFVWITP